MNEKDLFISLALGVVLGALLGGIFLESVNNSYYMSKSIENDCAHYDNKTGKFEWNKK